MVSKSEDFVPIAEILNQVVRKPAEKPTTLEEPQAILSSTERLEQIFPSTGQDKRLVYELNLAEYPWYVLTKNRTNTKNEVRYEFPGTDPKTGNLIKCAWVVRNAPGPFAGRVLLEFFQLWKEQGFKSREIYYGSVNQFFRRLGSRFYPSKREYQSFTEALRSFISMAIDCVNCFYDPTSGERLTLSWSPFSKVTYPELYKHSSIETRALFLQVDDLLFRMARNNGFLSLPFSSQDYDALTYTEQRYALYLSKLLKFQSFHMRTFKDLCQLGPITAKETWKAKQTLETALDGLIEKRKPWYFSSYDTYTNAREELCYRFMSSYQTGKLQEKPLNSTEELILERVLSIVEKKYEPYWRTQIRKHGANRVERAMGILRDQEESYRRKGIKYSPGRILKTILENDVAKNS